MKKITILFTIVALAFNAVSAQTIFGWETAVDNGDTITETMDGITVTVIGSNPAIRLADLGDEFGTSGNTVCTTASVLLITFTFNQPVVVNSILPLEIGTKDLEYTFTPTGGSNLPVVVAMVGGVAPDVAVDLNWVNVTAFTVTVTTPARMAFDHLSVYAINSHTVFNWETAVDTGDTITETIDGITVTITGNPDIELFDIGSVLGSSGKTVFTTVSSPSITFTFDQPVVINSILPLNALGGDLNHMYTPTGGTNSTVLASLVGGAVPGVTVDLNWVNVTAFTVTSSAPATWVFDDLSVNAFTSLSATDNYKVQKTIVYPNPVENTLYIKTSLDLKSIKLYNNLGQLVLQSKKESIHVSQLSKGLYFLLIHTSQGTETKRIIKK